MKTVYEERADDLQPDFAAGIHSPHNACQFREGCRNAEAEIARLRENVAPRASSEQTRRCEWCGEIAQGKCGCEAETEIARLREALMEVVAECADFVAAGEFGDPGTAKQLIEHFDSARKDTK
jgi:hypothetical protein